MITAKEARELEIWEAQLEQIDWGIKQCIISGGDAIYYKKDKLEKKTKEKLIELGYKVISDHCAFMESDYKITWSEE